MRFWVRKGGRCEVIQQWAREVKRMRMGIIPFFQYSIIPIIEKRFKEPI